MQGRNDRDSYHFEAVLVEGKTILQVIFHLEIGFQLSSFFRPDFRNLI